MDGASTTLPSVGINKTLITWGEPIGYKSGKPGLQDITGGGFRITCSTTQNFTPDSLVSCFAGGALRPLSERSATLSLPSHTLQYYAAVQVVRNINGNEVVDDKKTTTGSFCTSMYNYK